MTKKSVQYLFFARKYKTFPTVKKWTAIYLLFGEDALNKLLQSYQSAGGYVWPKMKEHIIERLATQAITIAEFAESSGMEEYRTMAQDMLQNKA